MVNTEELNPGCLVKTTQVESVFGYQIFPIGSIFEVVSINGTIETCGKDCNLNSKWVLCYGPKIASDYTGKYRLQTLRFTPPLIKSNQHGVWWLVIRNIEKVEGSW